MKAARGFTFGDGKDNVVYKQGDEVPDKIIKEMGDNADHLILEKVLKKNPSELSREQLVALAQGNAGEDGTPIVEEGVEFNEADFREGMSNFTKKADLVEWAETLLGIEGLDHKATRPAIEDAIVGAMQAEPEDDESDDGS